MAAWDATSRNQWTYCHLAKAINGVLYGPEIKVPRLMRINLITTFRSVQPPQTELQEE